MSEETGALPDPDREIEEEKKTSGRLVCSSKDVLDKLHPLDAFFEDIPSVAEALDHSDIWQTAASLIKEKRQLKVRFPFTEKVICVSAKTYFKVLCMGIFKKARFSTNSEEETLSRCHSSVERAVALLVPVNSQVSESSTEIDLEDLEEVINESKDPFILRTNNKIGRKLPEDIKKNYFRKKIPKTDEERDEIIETGTLDIVMLNLYCHAVKKAELSDIETIYLYLLLLDPKYQDLEIDVVHQKQKSREKFRQLLLQAFRYSIGITYYGHGDNSNENWTKARDGLTKHVSGRVFDVLIGGSASSKKSDSSAVQDYPEVIENIKANVDILISKADIKEDDLLPLPHPNPNTNSWRLPNSVIERLQKRVKKASSSSNYEIVGLLNLIARNSQSGTDLIIDRKLK
jgi:hypothetical protein